MPWIPWDAEPEEVDQLSVIREAIPELMRPALVAWLQSRLTTSHNYTQSHRVIELQTALRVEFTRTPEAVETVALVQQIMSKGEKLTLRVVDYVLNQYAYDWRSGPPAEVGSLLWHLDMSSAAVTVGVVDGTYRLARRMPEGVDEAAQLAIDAAPPLSQRHLASAIREIQSMSGNTSLAMTEAIRAVEAAASPVVIPNDPRPQLAKIVSALRAKSKWSLVLSRRDDDYPDHRAVLLGMLETLAFAQQDRHAGQPPSPEEATAHVLLAANLVGWFATGAVEMNES